MIDHT